MKYIYQGQIVDYDGDIKDIIRSYIYEENTFAHVILNDEQVKFHEENPNATAIQVFYMDLEKTEDEINKGE